MPQDGKVSRWLSDIRARMNQSAHTEPWPGQSYDGDRSEHRKLSAALKSVAAKALLGRDRHLRDVPHEYYSMVLDPRMVYSCAYFENGDEDLATAQLKKIDHVLTKIGLQPGQSLLDVDCGWGALVIRAAERFGARCVGITQSKNQFDWANECIKAGRRTARPWLCFDCNAGRRTGSVGHSEPSPPLCEDAAFMGGELQGEVDGAAATRR